MIDVLILCTVCTLFSLVFCPWLVRMEERNK